MSFLVDGPIWAGDISWMDEGSCQEKDPEEFYPENGRTAFWARRTCAECPVRQKCLDYAIDTNERWGIWGGLTTEERDLMRDGLLAVDPIPGVLKWLEAKREKETKPKERPKKVWTNK